MISGSKIWLHRKIIELWFSSAGRKQEKTNSVWIDIGQCGVRQQNYVNSKKETLS